MKRLSPTAPDPGGGGTRPAGGAGGTSMHLHSTTGTLPLSLIALLCVAIILRWLLVAEGGQYFFGDEARYHRAQDLYEALRHGDGAGIRAELGRPEHAGFTVVGAAVTALQHATAQFTRFGDWSRPEHRWFTIKLSAAWLSLFSVLHILLLHAIVRGLGGTPRQGLAAAACLGLCNSDFYYARHLLPYDGALAFALAGCWFSVRQPASWLARSLGAGVLAGLAYLTYNGYWYLVPVLAAIHGLATNPPARVRAVLVFASATVVTIGGASLVGLWAGGDAYWRTLTAFSRSITFGNFAEGWSLPWEYLMYAETWFGAALVIAIGVSFAFALRQSEPVPQFVTLFGVAVVLSYGLLVLSSVGLGRFVVYARTAKPIAVFICAIGGWAVDRVLGPRPVWRGIGWAGLASLAALNFVAVWTLLFPADVEIAVMRDLGNPKRTLSFSGSLYYPVRTPVARPDLLLVDAQMLYPLREPLPLPAGHLLFTVSHPLNYRPFQYEAHSPRERRLLGVHPPAILLMRLPADSPVPDDLPWPWRFQAGDRPDGHH